MQNTNKCKKATSTTKVKSDFEKISDKKLILSWIIILPLYFFPIGHILKPVLQSAHINTNSSVIILIFNYILDVVYIIALLFLWRDSLTEAWKKICNEKKRYILLQGVQGFVFTNAIRILFSTVAVVFLKKGHGLSENQYLLNEAEWKYPIFTAIMIFLLSPFIEELIFRGIIYRGLRKINVILGIILSSLCFGLIHLTTEIANMNLKELIPRVILYFGVALGLTLFYEWKKNIILNMWIHMIINIVAFAVVWLIH